MENSMTISQKIKNKTIMWVVDLNYFVGFSNPTSRYVSKGIKILIAKGYLLSHVHCSIIHNSQDTEAT